MEANGKVVLDIDGQKLELTNEFVKFERQEKETVEGKYSNELDPKELLKLYRETKDSNTEQGFKKQ